jgi:hypothetical protein
MYLVDLKEILTGRASFRSTRYKYLAGWKATLPAGLGYPLGYPDTRQHFGERGHPHPLAGIRQRIADDPRPSLEKSEPQLFLSRFGLCHPPDQPCNDQALKSNLIPISIQIHLILKFGS